jgi:hypothetical protein
MSGRADSATSRAPAVRRPSDERSVQEARHAVYEQGQTAAARPDTVLLNTPSHVKSPE